MYFWTEAEKDFVKANSDSMSNEDIAATLSRSVQSVKNCMLRLGIKRDAEFARSLSGKSMPGPENPNWKGGISKNHYHYKKIQARRYPEKVAARGEVRRALRSGRLVRGPCETCGTIKGIQAHHDDYSKPLEVRWFCRPHHNEIEKSI